jgi:hypothetical protein
MLYYLNYVDFKPLSGTTLVSGSTQGEPRISLSNNNMSAGDVNHILDDFKYNATVNSTGWSNVNLNIGGKTYLVKGFDRDVMNANTTAVFNSGAVNATGINHGKDVSTEQSILSNINIKN